MSVSSLIDNVEIAGIPEVLLLAAVLLLFFYHKKNNFRFTRAGWMVNRFRFVFCFAIFCGAFVCFFTAAVPVNADISLGIVLNDKENEFEGMEDPIITLTIYKDGVEPISVTYDAYDFERERDADTQFVLTITPPKGYKFDRWGNTNGFTQGFTCSSSANTCTFFGKDINEGVGSIEIQVYIKEICQISVSASPTAGGTVSGGRTCNNGETVTLTATPNNGYSFVNWMESGKTVGTELTYSFTAYGEHDLTANFKADSDQDDPHPDNLHPEDPVFYPLPEEPVFYAQPEEPVVYALPEDEIGAYVLLPDGTKEYLLFHTYAICMDWLRSDELCSGPERCFHKDG